MRISYFLDKSGAQTKRMLGRPGEGHIEIAKEVLTQHRIAVPDDKDCYEQMFKLNFVRVLEHDDGTVEAEHGPALTTAQERFFEGLRREGRKVDLKKASI